MTKDIKIIRLESLVLDGMVTRVEALRVIDLIPQQVRPSVAEMEEATTLACENKPIPESLEMKLEAKRPMEFLQEFCDERGLCFYYDNTHPIQGDFFEFRLKGFKNEDAMGNT